jgi:mannitol 2-dehydrogenase
MTEPYSQWVIEDEFCDGRPPLEAVGVQFVRDARPYALIKTRVLNGTHCAIGVLGALAGHETTQEVLADPVFRDYIERLLADEVQPLLPAVDGVNPAAYRNSVLARLANPSLGDTLARLRRNASAKVPVHLVPSIRAARAAGRPHPRLTLAIAGWLRALRGVDERGRPLALDDPQAARLRALAVRSGPDPRPLLAERAIFGALGEDPAFATEVEQALRTLDRRGARVALEDVRTGEARVAA